MDSAAAGIQKLISVSDPKVLSSAWKWVELASQKITLTVTEESDQELIFVLK